jgi:hypothetical protein
MTPPIARPALVMAAAAAAIVAGAQAVYAATPATRTLYVATTGSDDDNTCGVPTAPCRHLFYAIGKAAASAGDAVTILAAGGTYRENDEIDASALSSLTLGSEGGTVIVDGGRDGSGGRRGHGGPESVFTITGGTVTFEGLTIENGDADSGGGIDNAGATVTLDSSTVTGNTALSGAGIFNDGGTVTLNSSTVTRNATKDKEGEGGGIDNFGGTVALNGSAVTDNIARYVGGGIYNAGGTMTVAGSTITGNEAAPVPGSGGGIYQTAAAATILTRTTVASNYPDNCIPTGLCR